jgi:hypothetical protein
MKSLKYLTLALAVVAFSGLQAQNLTKGAGSQTQVAEEPTPELDKLTTADACKQFAEEKVLWLEGTVGALSNPQKQQIKDIFTETYLEAKALRDANPGMKRPELREKAEPLMQSARERAYNVLTPEQQEKAEAWKAERGGGNRARNAAGSRARQQTEELDEVVNLSTEQKEQILELNTRLFDEGKAWNEANPNATADEKRNYSRELNKKRMEGYKSILNQEQKDKFMEYRRQNAGSDME